MEATELNNLIESAKKFEKARKEAIAIVAAWNKHRDIDHEMDRVYAEAGKVTEEWESLYHAKLNLEVRIRERVKKYFTIHYGTEDNPFLKDIYGTDFIEHYFTFYDHAKSVHGIYNYNI